MSDLKQVAIDRLAEIDKERNAILAFLEGVGVATKPKRKLSEEALANIRKAQKARWAKFRKDNSR